MIDKMSEYISDRYLSEEYPVLLHQIRDWSETKPFAGLRVLDATPVFSNTLVKYLALLHGGAKLTVGIGKLTPFDPFVVEKLHDWGVPLTSPDDGGSFDVISDCAGVFCDTLSRLGYVELTRSGVYRYREKAPPIFFADAGKIKFIETSLGTGDGYMRALARLGYALSERKLVVFGGGKVGRGIAVFARRAGAKVEIVDTATRRMPDGVAAVDGGDEAAVRAAIRSADHIVSATGIAGALAKYAAEFVASRAVIANMGVEDEFGPEVPEERVLNAKRPLNFLLPEPTQLRYIDPTMALANAGMLELVNGRVPKGVCGPSPELEDEVLAIVRSDGAINEELEILKEF